MRHQIKSPVGSWRLAAYGFVAVVLIALTAPAMRAESVNGGGDGDGAKNGAAVTPANEYFSEDDLRKLDAIMTRVYNPATREAGEKELRRYASRNQAKIGNLLEDTRPERRRLGVLLAGVAPNREQAVQWLGRRLSLPDADLDVRRNAVKILVRMRDPMTFFPLIDAMADDDAEVRAAGAAGLGLLKDKRALDSLLGMLNDPSAMVRIQVIGALANLGESAAMKPLTELARTDTDLGVRRAVNQALAVLSGPRPGGPDFQLGGRRHAANDPLAELQKIGDDFGDLAKKLRDQRLESSSGDAPTIDRIRKQQDAITGRLVELIKKVEQQQSQSKSKDSKKQRYQRNRPQPRKNKQKQKQQGNRSNNPAQRSQLPSGAPSAGTPGVVRSRAAGWTTLDDIDSEILTEMHADSIDMRYSRLLRKYIRAILIQEGE